MYVTIWKKRSAATSVLSSLFCQYETMLTCQLCPVTHMIFISRFYVFVLALHAVHQSCLRRGPGAIRYRWGVRKTSSPVGRSSRGPVCSRVWTSTGHSWPRRESRDCEWFHKNTHSLTTQSKKCGAVFVHRGNLVKAVWIPDERLVELQSPAVSPWQTSNQISICS